MVGFPFPFWYKTATSRTASAAQKSRCGVVWLRLWLQKRSPMWAVQVLRLGHQVLCGQGSPKVNARAVAGRKHSQLTNIPEDSTRLWRLGPWLAALEDPWAPHCPLVLLLVSSRCVCCGVWVSVSSSISYWQSSFSLWPTCHRMGPYWCSLWGERKISRLWLQV